MQQDLQVVLCSQELLSAAELCAGDGKEGEVDPLDAFMADNKAAVAAAAPRPEQRPKLEAKSEPKAEPEEEEDPLEAFMRSQIEPAVAQQPALDQRPPDVDMKPAPDLKPSVPLAVVKTGVRPDA